MQYVDIHLTLNQAYLLQTIVIDASIAEKVSPTRRKDIDILLTRIGEAIKKGEENKARWT